MENYKVSKFAEKIGVSIKTLQRWDRMGILIADRTPTNRRYYTNEHYLKFKNHNHLFNNDINDKRKVIIYARVSSRNQKDDLKSQIEFLKIYCNAKGIIIDDCIEDFGSGLNYNCLKWNNLLNEVMENKIKMIVITHKDRFIRFGFSWFEKLCKKFNTKILIVNNEILSLQDELVQDIISILHVFSCRLYGLRKYKKQIKEELKNVKSI